MDREGRGRLPPRRGCRARVRTSRAVDAESTQRMARIPRRYASAGRQGIRLDAKERTILFREDDRRGPACRARHAEHYATPRMGASSLLLGDPGEGATATLTGRSLTQRSGVSDAAVHVVPRAPRIASARDAAVAWSCAMTLRVTAARPSVRMLVFGPRERRRTADRTASVSRRLGDRR